MANQYFKIDVLSFNNHYNNNGPFSIIKNVNKSTKTSCQKRKKEKKKSLHFEIFPLDRFPEVGLLKQEGLFL